MKKIAKSKDEEINLRDEIKKLEDDPKRHMNIIALYLDYRKPDLRTYGQLQAAIGRHVRSAMVLVPFFDDQILAGFKRAQDMTTGWTLETVIKILTK